MTVRTWRSRVGAAAVLLWLVALVITLAGLPPAAARLGDDLAQLATAALAAAAAGIAARTSRGRLRQGWAALAAVHAAWAAGQAAWTVLELRLGDDVPFPSVADLGFLLFPVGFGAAILSFPSERPRARRRDLLDGVIVAAGLAAFTWTTSLGAILDTPRIGPLALTILLGYPVADAMVLVMALWAYSRAVTLRTTLGRLCLALVAMAASDGTFAYLVSAGGYTSGSAVSIGWTGCFTLLTVAALQPVPPGSAAPPPAVPVVPAEPLADHAGGVLPYLPMAAAFTSSAVDLATTHSLDRIAVGLLTLTVALTLWRTRIAVVGNATALVAATQQRAELERRATVDPLTQLVNRHQFCELMGRALVEHRAGHTPITVAILDLDHFTTVNDGLGREIGDAVLVAVADRLAGAVLDGEVLARLDSDEFAVLARCSTIRQPRRSAELTERLRNCLATPLTIAGTRLSVSASFGVSEIGAHQGTPTVDQVLAQADIAMRHAKRFGPGAMTWHDGLTLPEAGDWQLRPMLEEGMANGEIVAWYQPVVELTTGRLHGFEALARWQHGDAILAPSAFLPVASRAGLMPYLTRLMLRQAAARARDWQDRPEAARPNVSVNVPPSLMIDPTFPDAVAVVLAEFSLPPGCLILEITEEALLTDLATAARVARRLRSMGVLLALDDFGAGYSSLTHLHRLPLDRLKIDRTFVQTVDTDRDGRRLLGALLAMCRSLDLGVVAEGIERPSQVRALRELGCELGQGHLIAAPGTGSVVEGFLAAALADRRAEAAPGGWQDFAS